MIFGHPLTRTVKLCIPLLFAPILLVVKPKSHISNLKMNLESPEPSLSVPILKTDKISPVRAIEAEALPYKSP